MSTAQNAKLKWRRNKEMIICTECGWEIQTAQWWNIAKTYEGKDVCDDCAMDIQMKHDKEQGITV